MPQKFIKRKEYMLYALEEYNAWMKAKEKAAKERLKGNNVPDPPKKSLYQIRMEWERKNKKSIYI